MEGYEESWLEWKSNPELFWSKKASKLHWMKKWDKIVDMSDPKKISWFPGGKLNLCYNCLDRPIEEGFGEKTILLHESLYTHEVKKYTYSQLLDQVSRLAGALHDCGVTKGDYVIINLPMIPETVIAILAAVRVGAPYFVISRGYTTQTLKHRIEEIRPKVIFSTNCAFIDDNMICFKSVLDDALQSSQHMPSNCIILQRKFTEPAHLQSNRDLCWSDVMQTATLQNCTPVEATEPLFLLYTSGSTGKPKGIIHAAGSFSVGIVQDNFKAWGFDGDVYWSLSEFAWLGGHCCSCFGPLLSKTATILYEGPSFSSCLDEMYRIYRDYGVTNTFVPISVLKMLRNKDPNNELSKKNGPFSLKRVMIGGSGVDHLTKKYAENAFQAIVLLLYGQTELGGPVTLPDLKNQPFACSGKSSPGWENYHVDQD